VAAPAKTKSDQLNLVAVVGGDEGAVKAAAIDLAARMAPADAGEFGVEIIDGNVDNAGGAVVRIHQTIEALQTFPFFGGGKLVWL
jgi:DNA polymerase-3 subunit delta